MSEYTRFPVLEIFFDVHISNALVTMVISVPYTQGFSPNKFQFKKRLM